MARRSAAAAALLAVVASGCAHVTTSEKDATIWLDGRPVGRSGVVWALGPPHTARVVVVAKDGRRAHALVEREFTGDTFQSGFYTMGLCFVFCWAYPDVHIPLAAAPPRATTWDDEAWDAAWLAPPGAPTPTSAPTSNRTSTSTSTTTTTTSRAASDGFGPWRH